MPLRAFRLKRSASADSATLANLGTPERNRTFMAKGHTGLSRARLPFRHGGTDLVRARGLEPPRGFPHSLLRAARLPIPATPADLVPGGGFGPPWVLKPAGS